MTRGRAMSENVTVTRDGPLAVVMLDRPEKHNAANDEMDRQLFAALRELHTRPDVRAVVWRGNGKSFSSGRDTTQLGVRTEDVSNLDFIERGHAVTSPSPFPAVELAPSSNFSAAHMTAFTMF